MMRLRCAVARLYAIATCCVSSRAQCLTGSTLAAHCGIKDGDGPCHLPAADQVPVMAIVADSGRDKWQIWLGASARARRGVTRQDGTTFEPPGALRAGRVEAAETQFRFQSVLTDGLGQRVSPLAARNHVRRATATKASDTG